MQCSSPQQVAPTLDTFIRERFQVMPDDVRFCWDIDLWDAGYLDSLGVVELVHFIESTFDVSVPGEMLFEPDFVRISGMARLICRLVNGSAEAETSQDVGSYPPSPIDTTPATYNGCSLDESDRS